MGATGLRAEVRRWFYRTLWALGRRYCEDQTCPTVRATGRTHYAWWHR